MKKRRVNQKAKAGSGRFLSGHSAAALFLKSFLLCAIFFGGAAILFIRGAMQNGPAGGNSSGQDAFAAQGANPADSFTMLFCCADDATGLPYSAALLRLDVQARRMVVLPVPTGLGLNYGGRMQTFSELFMRYGMKAAQHALASYAGIGIDYNCVAKTSGLMRIIGGLGGVIYGVAAPVNYTFPESGLSVAVTQGSQYLDANKIIALLASDGYDSGRRRYETQAGLIKAYLTQKLTAYYLGSASETFRTFFDNVDTDFSMPALLIRLRSIQAVASSDHFVKALTPSLKEAVQRGAGVCLFDENTLSAVRECLGAR